MPSKSKTPLGLNQWVAEDKPKSEDFNQDNLLVDTILQGKADVVKNPTPGNFAGLTGDGGIVDSGKSAAYFETEIANKTNLFAMLDSFAPVEMRRTTFRGKNLGGAVTVEQIANIKNGSFKGLFLGDYWVIGGKTWRIADFNYWLNCGDTDFTQSHLIIMPDEALYNAQMNETNITTGGYVGSKMYTTNLANAKTLVNSAFGSAVLVHRDLLVNAVSDGYSAGAWYDSTVELPNEIMIYGSYVHTPAGNGTIVPYRYTINKSQLALFQACPKFIVNRSYNQWLRDVVSAALFARVSRYGGTNSGNASDSFGVRPVFAIG